MIKCKLWPEGLGSFDPEGDCYTIMLLPTLPPVNSTIWLKEETYIQLGKLIYNNVKKRKEFKEYLVDDEIFIENITRVADITFIENDEFVHILLQDASIPF